MILRLNIWCAVAMMYPAANVLRGECYRSDQERAVDVGAVAISLALGLMMLPVAVFFSIPSERWGGIMIASGGASLLSLDLTHQSPALGPHVTRLCGRIGGLLRGIRGHRDAPVALPTPPEANKRVDDWRRLLAQRPSPVGVIIGAMGSRFTARGSLLFFCLVVVAFPFFALVGSLPTPIGSCLFLTLAFMLPVSWLAGMVSTLRDRRRLRRLLELGACPKCGYVSGFESSMLQGRVCPECGDTYPLPPPPFASRSEGSMLSRLHRTKLW